jgi:hypothetical protein
MDRIILLTTFAIALVSAATTLPETKSDYDRSYDFSQLKTWDFKVATRMPEDPVGTNTIWNNRIRAGLEEHLGLIGYRKLNDGAPDFLVAYFMGIKEKYDIRYIDYGYPGRWGGWGPWGLWGGWNPYGPVDVWAIPYNESTLVMDVIDTHTNQMVWRGYDTATIDFNKSEKTIHKSVEHLVKRFKNDVEKQKKKIR